MKKVIILSVIAAIISIAAATFAKDTVKPSSEANRSHIEAVFVLDTTGSMSGLISAAKEKIWAIANTLATSKPAPDIKMGLIGYRDRGDEYVTKITDLTYDIDKVYSELMKFSANGGGDSPESVNQAINEAVTKLSWSSNKTTYRVIFLVGDYPPHMDYPDDVKYEKSCKTAAEKGIIINTIQCGQVAETAPIWQDIAKKAEGSYFQVEQSGNAIITSTPFDSELTALSRELDKTRIYYGNEKEIALQKMRDKDATELYTSAPASAMAARTSFNASKAGELNFRADKELVSDVLDKKVKLSDLKQEELDPNLQKLKPDELKKYVEDTTIKRQEIQKKINELSEKRQANIKEQISKSKLQDKNTLDQLIFDCVKKQAAVKKITFDGGPVY